MSDLTSKLLVVAVHFLAHADDETVDPDSALRILEYIGGELRGSPDSVDAMRGVAEEFAQEAEAEGNTDGADRFRVLIDQLLGIEPEEG